MPVEVLVCAALFLLLDQWSKKAIPFFVDRQLSWAPFVRLTYHANRQRFFQRRSARVSLVIVWILALLSATILYRYGMWFQSRTALLGIGMALGGAASNLLDILRLQYVVDVVDLRWWPVFNLADVAIITGLIMSLCW